ncbi:7TM GPCR, serpentine chemoreceptor class i (Sri) family-containing protein [Strongyloides ratti]|uniref:7TM GPCR, serpentine chemoreceptor class i (Sri) family-containing protein n=1 Tax=Strongyloides ratti TaxID=34506 RepID=A0A090L070_STRRB|nr:7TM GPCR, serpentine chemoreceptor class i (Sri) family-containing protein [Strongyloides ratti]CEF60879.1 7TM GPCR, serpentine chemoreceptor class i (Sri) family-containing protein [Strongyloides ratti]
MCNYAGVTSLVFGYWNIMIVSWTYLYRFNIFVRKKDPLYFNKIEKFRLIVCAIIMPHIVFIFAFDAPLKKDDYSKYYNYIDLILEPYNKNLNTIILYNPNMTTPFTFMIFLGLIYVVFHIIHGIIFYVIPLEKKLKKKKKNSSSETYKILKRSIIQLRAILFVTTVFGLSPVALSIIIVTIYGKINLIYTTISNKVTALLLLYYSFSPFFVFYLVFVAYRRKLHEIKMKSKVMIRKFTRPQLKQFLP